MVASRQAGQGWAEKPLATTDPAQWDLLQRVRVSNSKSVVGVVGNLCDLNGSMCFEYLFMPVKLWKLSVTVQGERKYVLCYGVIMGRSYG